jgi:hypothetical protein
MAKLTLSVEDSVVERAKVYAAHRKTSVSALVERYLDAVSRPPAAGEVLPPALQRLYGVLRGTHFDRDQHLDHLERKYR